jgi:hypothetical protein
MKRRYDPPQVIKYESLDNLPEKIWKELQLDPTVFHEIMNLVQVITSQCDLLEHEKTPKGQKQRVKAIRDAAFRISDRIKQNRRSA